MGTAVSVVLSRFIHIRKLAHHASVCVTYVMHYNLDITIFKKNIYIIYNITERDSDIQNCTKFA